MDELGRSRNVWFFNCANTYSGNPKWLFEYVNRHRPEIDAYWICDSAGTIQQIRQMGYKGYTFDDPEGRAAQQRAGVFVVNQVKVQIPEHLSGATLLNLWHGVGVKSIERAIEDGYLFEHTAKKYIRNNKYYRDHQLFLVSSPAMEGHFRSQIGLDDDVIIRAGYPQNVFPRIYGDMLATVSETGPLSRVPDSARIALFCPTHRLEDPDFLTGALPDMSKLVEALIRTDTYLIVKVHPFESEGASFQRMAREWAHEERVIFWDNTADIYQHFPRIDLAIVDYSSILYDLIAAGVKSYIRYLPDHATGQNSVQQQGFSADYLELSCGTLAYSFEELLTALQSHNDIPVSELERLRLYFWAYDSDDSLERIVDRALKFEPRSVPLKTLHSFDVFDTVIHRKSVLPESIFHFVRERMRRSDLDFPQYLVNRYVGIRKQAEAAARESYRKREWRRQSGLLEIQYSDIFERISTVYGLTDDQVSAIRQWELEAELEAVVPDKERIDELKGYLDEGHDVVLISDMYLPLETVRSMVTRADATLGSLPIFLSSDKGVQKTTKRLYLEAFRELEYDYAGWVHHGDNELADGRRARELGIQTDVVPKTSFSKFEMEMASFIGTFDGYFAAGLVRDYRLTGPHSSVNRFAFNHVAGYWVPYVSWVVRDAAARGYSTLYFVSRDGYHLRRIADALIEAYGLSIRTEYIYGSRTAWRIASQVGGLDPDLFEPHGDFSSASNWNALLGTARLTKTEFLELFPAFEADLASDVLSPETRGRIARAMAMSSPFRSHLLRCAEKERELAVRYLSRVMDLDESFAVVEYWGRGYTQECLTRLLEACAGRPVENPFYYARSIYPTDGLSIRHNFTLANYSMLFVEAIFANLPHGTVLRYVESGEGVEPVVEPRSNNVELHEALEATLPVHARLYAGLPVLDRDAFDRDVFRFALEYRRTHPAAPIFVENLAALRDAVELGTEEREFAPELSLDDIAGLREGRRPQTRDLELSVARSSPAVRADYRAWRAGKPSMAPVDRGHARRLAGAIRRRIGFSR